MASTRNLSEPRVGWAFPAFFLWMAAVSVACLAAFEDTGDSLFDIPYGDKLAHFGFYLIAMVLALLGIRSRKRLQIGFTAAALAAFAVLLAYGGLIELLQDAMDNGRAAEWADMAANALGLAGGVASTKVLFHAFPWGNWEN